MNRLWLWKSWLRATVVLGVACLFALGVGQTPAHAQETGRGDEAPTVVGGRVVVRKGEFNPIVDGHAWFRQLEVIPIKDAPSLERTLIWHVPPRTAGTVDFRGTVRSATSITGRLEDIAWHDNRVFFLSAVEPSSTGQPLRRVLSMSALRGPGRTFEYRPSRPEVLPPIMGDAPVSGFVATTRGPVVLTVDADSGPKILTLVGSAWLPVRTPWMLDADPPVARPMGHSSDSGLNDVRVKLLGARDGFSIAVIEPAAERIDLWTANIEPLARHWPVPHEQVTVAPLVEWTRQTLPLRSARSDAGAAVRADHLVFLNGVTVGEDAIVAIDLLGAEVVATALRPSGPMPLARFPGFQSPPAVLPMAAPGEAGAVSTLAFAWVETKKDDSGRVSQVMTLREISGLTGRDLFSGPVLDMGFLPSRQYQMLVLTLVLVMVGVLIFVLRGDPHIVPATPGRTAFAEPIRRAAAAMMDYAPGAILVAVASGRGPMALLIPEFAVNGAEMDLASIGIAIALTIAHCTIGEAMFGRSFGKYLMGCRVISSAGSAAFPQDVRPKLWQALVRNIVRWTVPILALFVIFDPARRHPGDLAARTLVIVDLEEDRIGSDT